MIPEHVELQLEFEPELRRRRFIEGKAALLGLGILVLLALGAILAPLIAAQRPGEIDLIARMHPPVWAGGNWSRPLGTDALGRDVLSRSMYGARVSLTTGIFVVLLAGSVGTFLGITAAYMRGWKENLIMRIVDAGIAFPGLLLALAVLMLVGPGQISLILILSGVSWMVYARVTHGVVVGLREAAFVKAAEMVGCKPRRILARYILPNLVAPLLTIATLEFAQAVLAESGLSYLGFGIQPPQSSWGLMVAEGQEYISSAWWLVAVPGSLIAVTVFALNLVSGSVRLLADPVKSQLLLAPPEATTTDDQQTQSTVLSSNGHVRDQALAMPVLSVDHLAVEVPGANDRTFAVRDASLALYPGETLAVVGESGSGKTMTAMAIMGLLPKGAVKRGVIRWRGEEIDEEFLTGSLRGKKLTMIFQDPVGSLNPLKPIGKQVSEAVRMGNFGNRKTSKNNALELLDLVGIASPKRVAKQYAHELSGGMCQRVMIAMALAPGPDVMIADEPTTALDVTIQAQIMALIKDIKGEFGMSVLLIAHDLGVVAGNCDRVAVMYGGRVVEEGRPASMFERPAHPYTAGLLASIPRFDTRSIRLVSIPGSPPVRLSEQVGCPFHPRCPAASEQCSVSMPPMEIDEAGRRFACWHPVPASGATD